MSVYIYIKKYMALVSRYFRQVSYRSHNFGIVTTLTEYFKKRNLNSLEGSLHNLKGDLA